MFGLGMGEIVVIAIVALLFLGPDKLPDAAKSLGKTIRNLRSQTRQLTDSLEQDTEFGEAVREIRSALRDDPRRWVPPITELPLGSHDQDDAPHDAGDAGAHDGEGLDLDRTQSEALGRTAVIDDGGGDEPAAGGHDPYDDPDLPRIRPVAGTVARSDGQSEHDTPPAGDAGTAPGGEVSARADSERS